MEKLVIHKNKSETFKCHFDVEGVALNEVSVRLCLEFSDNKNFFFYGDIDKEGGCVIKIPRLPEIENKNGKMVVEAMADSVYFRLYECEVDLKNSVEVKMTNKQTTLLRNQDQIKEAKIHLSEIVQEPLIQEEVQPEPEVKEEQPKNKLFKKFSDQFAENQKKEKSIFSFRKNSS